MGMRKPFTRTPKHLVNGMHVHSWIPGRLNTDGNGIRVSQHQFATGISARPPELVRYQAQFHPANIGYAADAGIRAVAAAIDHPGHVVTGLSALALFGLPYFADGCDTTLGGPINKTRPAGVVAPRIVRRKAENAWCVRWRGYEIDVSPPADAVVDAIRNIRDGVCTWAVPSWVSDHKSFRAISLIDAIRRFLDISLDSVLEAARGKINKKWLEKVISLSSNLADSPMETEMRLMTRALLEGPGQLPLQLIHPDSTDRTAQAIIQLSERISHLGLKLTEQVEVRDGNRLITVFDLAIESLKIGLMYDGEHHLLRSQRDQDSEITLDCAFEDWFPLRFSAGTLPNLPIYLYRLIVARSDRLAA
ncbi:hypothetical protein GCM10027157_16310 [Corynebacterium aquatimens]